MQLELPGTMLKTFALLLVTSAAACGSTPDWFPSDLDRDETLARAGQAAAAKACDAFEDYLLDQYRESLFVQVACTALAIEQTEDAGACGDFAHDCIENPPAQIQSLVTTIVDGAGCGMLDYQSSGCGKTLSDLKACLDAAEDEIFELKLSITCALAGQSLPAGALDIDTPAACASIENACPIPE